MSNINSIDYSQLSTQLLPWIERQPRMIAWLSSLLSPLQTSNVLFNEYLSGCSYSTYSIASSYLSGDRVIYLDNGVYESISGSTAGVLPTDLNYWIEVNPSFIGSIERSKYSSQKLTFELALNRNFQIPGFIPTSPNTISQSLFAQSAQTIYIENQTVVDDFFMMDNSGLNSSQMVNNSQWATNYMGDYYTASTTGNFIIWVPNLYMSGVSESVIRSFADTICLAGKIYTINYYY